MAAFLDLCRFVPTAGGTTDWTFASAVSGCQSPVAANAISGTLYKFLAISSDLTQWEIAEGAYSSAGAGSFARTTVLYNSSGTGTKTPGQSGAGTKVSFSTVPQVACIGIKEDLISVEEQNAFTQTQQAQALANIGGVSGGTVNKFYNATLDFWQRGTSLTPVASTSNAVIGPDGWYVGYTASSAASPAIAQVSGRQRTVNALQITGATNITDIFVRQRIESFVAAPLNSQQVTVQAQVFNNTGGNITPTLTVQHANAADNFAAQTNDLGPVNLQACANGAWTLVAYTFAASASSSNGLEVKIDFGNNFGAGTKSIKICEMDIRATPGIVTGLNSAPPAPEMRPVNDEAAFVGRYLAPLAIGNGGATSTVICPVAYKTQGSVLDVFYNHTPPMRATPSLVNAGSGAIGWTNGNPTSGNNIAFFDFITGAFLTITGALTISLASNNKFGGGIDIRAGTSFNGSIGDSGNIYAGPGVIMLASAEL